jgi:hypothetical protein
VSGLKRVLAQSLAFFAPKQAQIVGLASKLVDAVLPARRKRRAVASSRSSRHTSARPLHGGTSPSHPKKITASSLSSSISAARKIPRAESL